MSVGSLSFLDHCCILQCSEWHIDLLSIYRKSSLTNSHNSDPCTSVNLSNYDVTSYTDITKGRECIYQWMDYELIKYHLNVYIYWFLVDLFKLNQSSKTEDSLEALISICKSTKLRRTDVTTPLFSSLLRSIWEVKCSSLFDTSLSYHTFSKLQNLSKILFSSSKTTDLPLWEVFLRLTSSVFRLHRKQSVKELNRGSSFSTVKGGN